MKNKILYISIFILVIASIIFLNYPVTKNVIPIDKTMIDIDNFVVNSSVDLDINSLQIKGFKFIQEPNLLIGIYKDYPNNSSLSLNLVKIDSNYYFRTIAKYVGDEQIDLKNVYINSNLISKAIILDVNNDNYNLEIDKDIYNEEVTFDTKITEKLPISDYLDSDSIKVVFMGFKKNVTFILPPDQFVSLKNSYLLIQQSIQ